MSNVYGMVASRLPQSAARSAGKGLFLAIHPEEVIDRSAIALLERHAFSHGLRVVDAIIAASALETASSLATANVKHYRVIAPLNLIQFKP